MQQQQKSTSPQRLEGRVLRSFEHGTRRKRNVPRIAAAEANEEGKDDAQGALDREALTSPPSPPSILEEENDSSILQLGVSKKRPRTVRRELPGLEEVLQDLESDPWFALQQHEQQQQLKQNHNVVQEQPEEAEARNQNVQSDPQTNIYSQESNQIEDGAPEAVMSKLRSLAPQIMQRRSKVGDDTESVQRRWVKKAAPLELPTMTMITPRTRKKIERLPRPGPAELARLAEIDETFLSMDQEREIGHAADEKQTLYSKLWIVARKRAYDLHMLPPVPLRDRVKVTSQPLGKKRKLAKVRECKIPETPKMRRSPRRDQDQAVGDLQDRENELAGPRVSMLRDRLQRADAATEAARGRIGELLQETRRIVPATALFEHRLKNLLSAASQKNQNKLQRMLTRLVRKYQRAQILPCWNKWRGVIDFLRLEAQNAAARRIQSLFTKTSCRHELEERARQQIRQRERHEVQLAHRIELRRRGPEPLQRAFRKYCARRELAYLRRRREAVVCVQCAWRARNCRIVLAALQAAKLHRNQSATHIQRVFRGHCARVRAGLLRKIEAVSAKERARLAAQAAIEARLMRIGAAALMQGWWRSLQRRWLTRAMVMVMKRRAAIRIQSFWRSVWAVLELKRAIARKRDQDARESAAATMLQKRFRIRRAQALVERIKVEAAEAKAQRDASRIENMQDRTMNIFGRTLNVTKNRRALHELRSKIDPFTASRQERAATRIQRVWRGYRARRRVKRRRAAENQVLSKLRRDKVRAAALQMQKRWRGIRERRRLEMERQNRAASLIQAKYRARIAKRNFLLILERHKAASRVQKRWRGRLARKMMVLFREEMRVQNAAARVCQRAVQRYLFRKGYRDRLENERTWFELRQQGAIETILAKRAEGYRMLLHSGFLNSAKGGGELRALFCELSEPLAQLSGDKFVKMVLACPGLAHLKRKTLDIIFAKAKKPDSKLLGYPEFRESLIGLGMHLYVAEGVDAKIKAYKDTVQAERAKAKRGRFSGGSSGAAQSAEAARAQRQAEKNADKMAETQIRDEAIGQFTFRRHRGRRGLLLRVLHEHIWKMEFAQRQREALDVRAARRMEWASVMVQRRFRGVASRSILDRIREQRHRKIEAERQRAASTRIQTFWRMCLAKRRVRALARRCLQKCIDAETGDPYWFNTQTGESSWTKPKLLGDDDAEVSIVMPQKDDEFVIKCAKCRAEMATVACLDCADPFCEDCHRQEHHGAAMHSNIPIPLCTECNFQAATRNCTPCQRKFCCSCFEMAHFISPPWQDEPVCAQPSEEQSQLAAHKWQPLIKVCAECDARAVRWRCEECGDDFCARCLKELHRKGNRRLHNFHPLSYHSLQLEVRERQVRAKKRAIAEKERRKVMQKQAEQDNMEKVALKLQSLYRGRRDRAVGKSLLRDARLRERKHWRLVKHDMAERKKLNYRLQAAVGIAPILEMDDDETKDRKRMGWKATPWGRAAVAAGVALPIGEPLPGPIKVHDNETLFIHVIEEWRSLISVDEYIRLDNQYFLVKHIGEQDENDPGKPVDTVQMMREEKLRKRQENDPWAVPAASEESSTAGENGKSKKKNKKKQNKKTKDQNSGEDQGGEVGPGRVEDDPSANESKATGNEREKKKRARRAIMNKAKQVKKKGFQACTLQIHLDAPYSGEIPVEVRGFFVGSFNLAQDAIVKAKRADKQAIKEKMGGRLADVMAKTKEFIAEKADEYIDPDTAARLNKRFTGVARLVGKRRSSIASIEDMDDEDLGQADEAPKVSTRPKSATPVAKASLPPGWEEFLDDASGTPYFYNHSTGESVWERPSE